MSNIKITEISLHSSDCQNQEIYNKIKVLGKGAFGEAVLYRKQDDSLVVWKEIDLSRVGGNSMEVDNEIDILSLLTHPNIVQYYNHFFCDEKLYIEMEYANGGSLCKKIQDQNNKLMSEDLIVWFFYQICIAIEYLHEMGIIHRDLKTLNIFLTKSEVCKLGDFGMSKQMKNTDEMADTVLGTPYYMSPELIKGVSYNTKSDIWALGCVLHELLTLEKTFQASNTLKLASEIMKCNFKPIDGIYSKDLQDMIRMCLKIDPNERAGVKELLSTSYMQIKKDDIELNLFKCGNYKNMPLKQSRETTQDCLLPQTTVTSSSTELYIWGGGKQYPQQQTAFDSDRTTTKVSVGDSFIAVITIDNELYTWMTGITSCGSGVCGQLGHGDTAFYKSPKLVAFFKGLPVKDVACGNDFTICLTESNEIYSFGSNYYGCLGVGQDIEQAVIPTKLEYFHSIPVTSISCGDNHVMILDQTSKIYAFGCGEFGRLGTGCEDDSFEPATVPIKLPEASKIVSIACGYDCTFFVTDDGKVLACGSNEHNKLGFNQIINGVAPKTLSYDIQCFTNPKPINSLNRCRITSVSSGKSHSAAIDDFGTLHMFGSNEFGQLGQGNTKQTNKIVQMNASLGGKTIIKAVCADGFTVAATSDSQLYAWGLGAEGRLGLDVSINSRGVACTSLPKPIFGTLYKVKSMVARTWTTAIIAERVLSQKSLRPSSGTSRSRSPVNNKLTGSTVHDPFHDFGDLFSPPKKDKNGLAAEENDAKDMESTREAEPFDQSSSLPPWLKDEMMENEIIPLVAQENRQNDIQEPKNELPLVQTLKAENMKLKDTVHELEKRMHQLESRLVMCVCSSKSNGASEKLENPEWECDV